MYDDLKNVKQNGDLLVGYSPSSDAYIAYEMLPGGNMGWNPGTRYYSTSKDAYDHWKDPGFDPRNHVSHICDERD